MSATFNEDVQTLKELVLHNPVSGAEEHLERRHSEICRSFSEETSGACGGTILLGVSFLILSH